MLKPITFPEQTCVYAENQPEYIPLPVYRSPSGECISCWHIPLWERIKLIFTGKMWISQLTFNQPLQPILPMTFYPFIVPNPTEDDLEAKARYEIDHKTIGSDEKLDGRSAI